ncbi:MAG: SdpI family protein [Thermoanaerobaculia bacterium]|nr:SdpI family protein [Thermoanaerobaculia bacterium]
MANFSGLSVGVVGLFFVMGLAVIGVSILFIRQRVKPNRYFGVSTRKTLASEAVWYAANRYAGKALIIAGCVQVIGSVVLFLVRESLFVMTLGKVGLAVFALSVFAAMFSISIYVRRLPVDPEPSDN